MPFFSSVLARRTFGYLLAGTLALLAIVLASTWLAARTSVQRVVWKAIAASLADAPRGARARR